MVDEFGAVVVGVSTNDVVDGLIDVVDSIRRSGLLLAVPSLLAQAVRVASSSAMPSGSVGSGISCDSGFRR